jgi:hypothetical protein
MKSTTCHKGFARVESPGVVIVPLPYNVASDEQTMSKVATKKAGFASSFVYHRASSVDKLHQSASVCPL